ncbi:MAG: flap endonuclease-1 [Candidatus Bathyarchaeia archaeon]|nr:flap endonuclease-1 [Candidatus Bathyarchaeota archaeon A05DMB-4]MDH7595040.1 flap endonuclease-1 [Candidatus Bathyarchaeota archaeon]
MGVDLKDLVPKTVVSLETLGGKSIAIDAYNALYQFLAIIRQPDGTPLKDSSGKITSHLSGLLYRTANLAEMGIKTVYVFDGAPPALKEVEIKRRMQIKEEATIKYEKALAEGKMEEARTYAQMTSRLKDYMAEDSKRLLNLMGIPWIQAPSEGEAQAAHLTKKGATNFCASQDYDSILFGAPLLIRNVTISGRRKLPGKPVYVEVVPEIVELDKTLKTLGITYEQLVDLGILIGTDYNPEGVKGIGPKTALKLIKEHGSLEKILETTLKDAKFPVEPQRIREVFLHPRVRDDYKLEWREPDIEGVVDFLCREKDFTEDRVRKALEKMTAGMKETKAKTTLEKWFG